MLPPAPGLLSTTNGWPNCSASLGPSVRARMSTPPPGAKPTTMRTGPLGQSRAAVPWASTDVTVPTRMAATRSVLSNRPSRMVSCCAQYRAVLERLRDHQSSQTRPCRSLFGVSSQCTRLDSLGVDLAARTLGVGRRRQVGLLAVGIEAQRVGPHQGI